MIKVKSLMIFFVSCVIVGISAENMSDHGRAYQQEISAIQDPRVRNVVRRMFEAEEDDSLTARQQYNFYWAVEAFMAEIR